MFQGIRTFFADPARQAFGWAALGIAGVGLAGGGLLLMTSDKNQAPRVEPTSTLVSTPTLPASATASRSPESSATVTPSPTPGAPPSVEPTAATPSASVAGIS